MDLPFYNIMNNNLSRLNRLNERLNQRRSGIYEHHYHSIDDLQRMSLKDMKDEGKWEDYWSSEQSIIGARASVMVYDDIQKKWVPSGSSSGLSKVQIYHHQQNNTFRVVGRKLQDHEVVINCSILKGLKYNQATATFHQWRDSKFVYGLNFSSQQDAEAFARAMMHSLEVLSGRVAQSIPPLPGNGTNYEEDMGYRTMTREDAAILQQQQQMTPAAPSPQTPTSQNPQNTPQSPPTPQGHHRTSSAPPAPQPPPMSMAPPIYSAGTQQVGLPPQTQSNNGVGSGGGGGVGNSASGGGGVGVVSGPVPYQQQQSYTQQQSQNSYGSNQSLPQYNQPIYVSSNSSQSLNQQLQQHSNGPIYVASSASSVGLPTSASNNSVGVYGPQVIPPPIGPPPPNYGQTNGSSGGGYGNPSQYAPQPPIPLPQLSGPPQAPPPPPAFNTGFNIAPPQIQPIAIPPAAPSLGGGGAPPPPPPPPMGGLSSSKPEGLDMNSLAAQLQNAKLKRNQKTTPPPTENSGSSTSSGGSGNYGTIGRSSTGMASMMDEMAKTLARRRAQVEKKEPEPSEEPQNARQRPWEKSNTLPHKLGSGSVGNNINSAGTISNTVSTSGPESPRPLRKRFGSASEETILKQVNGDGLSLPLPADLDTFKADIIREMRMEITKAKQEIIDAIKSEFNRR